MRMPRLIPLFAILFATVCVVLLVQPFTPGVEAGRRLAPTASRSGATSITTDTILISTYSFAPALFTSTNTTYNIPYQWLHWSEYDKTGRTKSDKAFTRLTLENDWLRVSILPELGGRVYEMIFKPTGHNELYNNPVLKPTHWGPPEQGWWLAAGGIEWGLPVEEHGYETAVPWSYAITQTSEGVGVTLRDSTQADRLRASVEVFLPDDRAVLIIRPTIENARGVPLDFKWWSNAMLAIGEHNTVSPELRFVFPVDMVTVHSTNDDRLPGHGWPGPTGPQYWITWPIYNGIDWSRLGNFDEWFGFFGRPQAQQDFVGVYDTAADEGVVRIFPREVARGIKGFAMGWAHPIGSSEWTDDGSTYVELHGGLAPTFWDSVSLDPGQSIAWEEKWYPVAGLNGLTAASGEVALHLEQSGSRLTVAVAPTRDRDRAHVLVLRRYTCQVLGNDEVTQLQAGLPISRSLATNVSPRDASVVLTSGDDEPLLLHQITDDGQPPTNVGVGGPGAYVTQTAITVTLSAMDWDCIRSYDVQVKDGLYGEWTPWLTGIYTTTAVFTGTHGHMYFFRARARDLAGNLSRYTDSIWGNAWTAVLLTPAPVLEGSLKLAPQFIEPNRPIEYAVVINNSGNLTANVTLTDTLPLSLTTVVSGSLWSNVPPTPTLEGDRLLWSGIVPTAYGVVINYALTPSVDLPHGVALTNTLVIEGGALPVTRTAIVVKPYRVFLPLLARSFSQ